MAFGQLGYLGQRFVGLLVAVAGQAQFDHALDRQADLAHVDLGLVAGDNPAGLELGHPLGHRRRRQVHLARQLREGGAAIVEQGGEQHAVVLVHGLFLPGFDSIEKHPNNHAMQSVRVI